MIEVKKEFYSDGSIRREEYYLNNICHREDGPSCIHYHSNGNIESEKYYVHGLLHRENKPAIIRYYADGRLDEEIYFMNGRHYRENFLPDKIKYYSNQNICSIEYWGEEVQKIRRSQELPTCITFSLKKSLSGIYFLYGMNRSPDRTLGPASICIYSDDKNEVFDLYYHNNGVQNNFYGPAEILRYKGGHTEMQFYLYGNKCLGVKDWFSKLPSEYKSKALYYYSEFADSKLDRSFEELTRLKGFEF
jgi:hypothetical protein